MKLPPALKALLAQVIGTAAALAIARSGLLPGGLWPVAVIQALAATVVANLRSKLHPLWYIAVGAVLGLSGAL